MNDTKFIQIISCPWDGENGRRTYSIFGLTDMGKVYRHDRSSGSWRSVGNRIMSAEQIKQIDKAKYGAKYQERGIE